MRQSQRCAKIPVAWQFLSGHLGNFSKKSVFRYGLGECEYQISDLSRFSFGQGKETNTQKDIRVNIGAPSPLRASRGFA